MYTHQNIYLALLTQSFKGETMFFSMIFFINKKNQGIFSINPLFKINLSIIFTLILLSGIFSWQENIPLGIFFYILIIILLFSTSYRNTYIFDKSKNMLTSIIGFGIFIKKTTIPLNTIRAISLDFSSKSMIYCFLHNAENTIIIKLDETRKRNYSEIKKNTKKIADYLACHFFETE